MIIDINIENTSLMNIYNEFEKICNLEKEIPEFSLLSTIQGIGNDNNYLDTIERFRDMAQRKPTDEELKELWFYEKEKNNYTFDMIKKRLYKNKEPVNWWIYNGQSYMIHPENPILTFVKEEIKKNIGGENTKITGCFFYDTNMFRVWHTNKWDLLGWRIYFIKTNQNNKSFFSYLDHNNNFSYEKLYDNNLTIRCFKITSIPPLWHSIYSECQRYSLGIYLDDDTFNKVLNKIKKI